MGQESYEQGCQGEERAVKFLEQKGYQILARNYHSQQGEIDIVARDGEFLVFVEVKSYSCRSYGSPLGAIRKSKRESLTHAARSYLYKNKIENTYCRFDVVAIYRRFDNSLAIELYQNAFEVGRC